MDTDISARLQTSSPTEKSSQWHPLQQVDKKEERAEKGVGEEKRKKEKKRRKGKIPESLSTFSCHCLQSLC